MVEQAYKKLLFHLVSFKNKRAGQRGRKQFKKSDIKLTNTTRKITNSIFNLDFFQTEKVEDKIIPRTVVIYFADEARAMYCPMKKQSLGIVQTTTQQNEHSSCNLY